MNNARTETIFNLGRLITDGLGIYFALIGAYLLRMKFFEIFIFHYHIELFPAPSTLFPFATFQNFAWQFTLIILAIFALKGRYRLGADEKLFDEIVEVFWAICAGMAVLLVYFFFAKFHFFSRLIFGFSWGLALLFVLSGRVFLRLCRQQFLKYGLGVQKVLLLGTGHIAQTIGKHIIDNPHYEIVGVLSESRSHARTFLDHRVSGTFNSLSKSIAELNPDEIWLLTDKVSEKISGKLIRTAHTRHKKFRFVPDELSLDLATVKVSTFSNFPLITISHHKIEGWGAFFKSLIDISLALTILILTSPITLFVALLIWFDDMKSPIIYASKRVGKNGRIFNCYKFRTMVPDADKLKNKLIEKNQRKGGVLFKIDDDPRITKLGKTLRKYSLDELPQLFNVLHFDMSLIGPRPHLPEEVKKYPEEDLQILSVKPGITGFAQINGRSSLSFEEEMQHEMFYIKNWSIWLDIVIFFKSIIVVLKGENAS